MTGLSLVLSWSWVTFAKLQEARFPILQESAYTTDSDTELSLALHVRFWPIPAFKKERLFDLKQA